MLESLGICLPNVMKDVATSEQGRNLRVKIYSLLGGESTLPGSPVYLVCKDLDLKTTLGTLILPLVDGSCAYVKNLFVCFPEQIQKDDRDAWIPLGSPCQICINKLSLKKEVGKQGVSSKELQFALEHFVLNNNKEVLLHVNSFLEINRKYSVRMRSGVLRIVKKHVYDLDSEQKISVLAFNENETIVQIKVYRKEKNPNLTTEEPLNTISKTLYFSLRGVPGIMPLKKVLFNTVLKVKNWIETPPCKPLVWFVDSPPTNTDLPQRVEWALDVVSTLSIFHELGFVFNDIKSTKFFIYNNRVSIASAASTSALDSKTPHGVYPCPEKSSELMDGRPPKIQEFPSTLKDDSWGLGILLFILFHGTTKYDPTKAMAWLAGRSSILAGAESIQKLLYRDDHPIKRSMDAIIAKLLEVDPEQRMSVSDALKCIEEIQRLAKANTLGKQDPLFS